MIVCNDRATAEKIRQEALADPEKFGQPARQHSVDPTSRQSGRIDPADPAASWPEGSRRRGILAA